MVEFSCKTKIYSGSGSLAKLSELGITRLMLVADPYFVKNGTAGQLVSLSGAKETKIFDKVTPDPSVELAAEATAAARELAPDTVIALGGGSAMDLAKALTHFLEGKPRLVMVPTTSGSGSEVTDFAVLTHGEAKYPLVSEDLRPDVAILDSDLLLTLPKSLVADSGFDVLGHAVEALTGKNANSFTDALASAAFCTVLAKLPASYGGNLSVRGQIHQAATMAGLAFTHAGLGLCHALAHSLGGVYHIPHGRLIAMLLPEVIGCNAHACPEKFAALARAAGLPGSADSVAVRSLVNALARLRKALNMPGTLKEAGIDPRQVWHQREGIVQTALEDPCCATNPITPEPFMVRRILEAVTGRG